MWKSWKGDIYNLMTVGKHTETGKRYVVYEDKENEIHIRPYEMFHGMVKVNGVEVKRYTHMGHFNEKSE